MINNQRNAIYTLKTRLAFPAFSYDRQRLELTLNKHF